MAMRAGDLFRIDRDEYLATETDAATKSEWVDGVLYNMAGASKRHVETVMTLVGLLYSKARSSGCFIGSSDLLVQTENAFYYPDLVVSCDPDEHERIETRPCFIVEVLSPSTKRADRHEKRDAYCALETMVDYWVVDPDAKVVEVWTRTANGWSGSHHTASEPLHVTCLDVTLKVVDIVGV